MPEPVVCGSLARVGEYLVRLIDLFEAVLGSVALVPVGVEFKGQLTERLLDVLFGGVTRYTQDVVVVTLARGHLWIRPLLSGSADGSHILRIPNGHYIGNAEHLQVEQKL